MRKTTIRAVFDTNVIVSGFLSPFGYPGKIVDLLRVGAVIAVLDDRILLEYHEVLRRPKLKLNWTEVKIVIDEIIYFAEFSVQENILPSFDIPDSMDLPFIESAFTNTCPIVTGNVKHFPKEKLKGIQVLSPKEFIDSFK